MRPAGWPASGAVRRGGGTVPHGPCFCTVVPEIEQPILSSLHPGGFTSRRVPGREGRTSLVPWFPYQASSDPTQGNAGLAGRHKRPRSFWPRAPRRSLRFLLSDWTGRGLTGPQRLRGVSFRPVIPPSGPLPQSTWGMAGEGCILPGITRSAHPVTVRNRRVEGVGGPWESHGSAFKPRVGP